MPIKQDSNLTGLAFAEEATLRTLPGSPVWFALEPNSYSDFGGQLATVARNPINPTRQRKKGTVTDLDASGGFNQDLTMSNLTRLLQGFFFADIHEKPTSSPMNGTHVAMTAIAAAADDYTAASGLPTTILAGSLVYASGFGVAANNGVKVANATSTGTAISVSDSLTDEASPPAAAKVEMVGFQFDSGTSAIAMVGNIATFTDSTKDLTTLGLVVGEWVYLGDDTAGNRFANNAGFARISAIAAGTLTFDKVSWTAVNEAGTAKTIRMYFGNFLRNEPDAANIVRRTYNLERQLGADDNGTMSEYLVGAVANELTLNVPQADKVTADLSFVALDNEQFDGLTGIKSGTRVAAPSEEALNTSSNFARIHLSLVDATDSTVAALFAYATDMSVSVNNNVSPLKAIGTLGGFDTTAGTFEVGGNLTAYFATVDAVQAVRSNSDVTLDMVMVKANRGIVVDLPLIALGDGRLAVELNQAITLPLETNAAQHPTLGYTLLMQFFPYLPDYAG